MNVLIVLCKCVLEHKLAKEVYFSWSMQIWRMSDLIYRPEDEVLTELEKFKSHVIACASKT